MTIFLLLAGLLPIMFFADIFADNGASATAEGEPESDPPDQPTGAGDMLDGLFDDPTDADTATGGSGTLEDPLHPITDDGAPSDGNEFDPEDVLAPDTGDATPTPGTEIDPSTVLRPIEEDDSPITNGAAAPQAPVDPGAPNPDDPSADSDQTASEETDDSSAAALALAANAALDPTDDPAPDDSLAPGETGEVYWVYYDGGSSAGAADISSFSVGEDLLRVTLTSDFSPDNTAVEVHPSDNGEDAVVYVNGTPIAILRAAPGATAADVILDAAENIFA